VTNGRVTVAQKELVKTRATAAAGEDAGSTPLNSIPEINQPGVERPRGLLQSTPRQDAAMRMSTSGLGAEDAIDLDSDSASEGALTTLSSYARKNLGSSHDQSVPGFISPLRQSPFPSRDASIPPQTAIKTHNAMTPDQGVEEEPFDLKAFAKGGLSGSGTTTRPQGE
jgi:hypothetical protein